MIGVWNPFRLPSSGERGWQTHRVFWRTSDEGVLTAAQAVICWDLGRPDHERGAGLSIVDAIEVANVAVAGWMAYRCDCPCHEVVQPGLVPCPNCKHSSRYGARP